MKDVPIPHGYLALKDVARKVGLTPKSLWLRCKAGEVPAMRLGDGRGAGYAIREAVLPTIRPATPGRKPGPMGRDALRRAIQGLGG